MNHDQGFIDMTIDWLRTYIPSVYSAFSALSISALMSIKNNKSMREVITSMLICGILALSFSGMLEYFGLPPNSASVVGGVIGLLGVDELRTLFFRKFNVSGNNGDKP